MARLTEAQAAQSLALTQAYRAQQNRDAAKVAALVALYFQKRVNVTDPLSIERWLDIVIPQLIRVSDGGALSAVEFFAALRRIEAPGAAPFVATAATGTIDPGVRKSLLTVGPYDVVNKAREIRALDVSPQQERALMLEAQQVATKKLAAAAVRHAQAGGRQTIYDASANDRVALGYVRVTREKPCYFCAMLASRGLRYRAFSEDSFQLSNQRFTGDGDAKVHDECRCSLKPVYAENDPVLRQNQTFVDLWDRYGAGGGDAVLRFRRGYTRWVETGQYMSFDEANEGLRAA